MPVSPEKNPRVQLVLGTQWGDEGKGKIVDLLGEDCDLVVRFQGGPNAGHTVAFDGEQFILHLIPTGILRPHTRCIVGNGVVINPESMLEEIALLEDRGIDVVDRLSISRNAHLILPYHVLLDKTGEDRAKDNRIGTTGRGIGPCYADKASRMGVRVGDLLEETRLEEKISRNVALKNRILESVYGVEGVSKDSVLDALRRFKEKVGNCIEDTTWSIQEALAEGKRILLEGAQGMLLDLDFGTYPYVTSSNTMIGGVCTGCGVHPKHIDRVIGIQKAYTTRVGNGPFPTELTDAMGEKVREMGGEYGATTGRPRRCGWFDGMIAKYAVAMNGIDTLAVTKLDVLDRLEEIRLCVGYRYAGRDLPHFPSDCAILEKVEPVYEKIPGWMTTTSGIRAYSDLPDRAKEYLKRIECVAGVPIGLVSVGPDRNQTILVD